MAPESPLDARAYPVPMQHSEQYYQQLHRKNIVRLVLTYLLPLVILTVYFAFSHRQMVIESGKAHLLAIAENQANTLDLFLRERVVNLSNVIDNPKLELPPSPAVMQSLLAGLQQASEAFVDLGFFDSDGIQVEYVGPFPQLEKKDYSRESWWVNLKGRKDNFIITDIYLGFRNKPHFTIATSRTMGGRYCVLRATLDPEKFLEYVAHRDHPGEVYTSVINEAGQYQLVHADVGSALDRSPIIPKLTPRLGAQKTTIQGTAVYYAYSWLRTGDWALIVQPASDIAQTFGGVGFIRMFAFSAVVIILIFFVIVVRAGKIVEEIRRADRTRAELSGNLLHASKLAAVGELASGIAHEINNPLAIINEEVGLIQDSLNPEFKMARSLEDLKPSLDHIQAAVFRCRDITRKLLAFVRKTEMNLQTFDIHEVIDDVLQGFYRDEIAVSGIEIVRNYAGQPAPVVGDRNQLQQVFLNLLSNAIDAMKDKGRITIATSLNGERVHVAVADTGTGMSQEHLDKIFLPFFTTKGVGKGTGLGLSISYGIIQSLGGNISVSSVLGEGSTFSIDLPLAGGGQAKIGAEENHD